MTHGPAEQSAGEVFLSWLASTLHAALATGRVGVLVLTGGAAVGIAIALALPPHFTSAASFIAQSSAPSVIPAALQGLAASVGLNAAKDYSPQFYADLLSSRPVLLAVLDRSYTAGPDATQGRSYLEIEGFDGPRRDADLEAALKHLRKRVMARADVRTNIITVNVRARYPALSRDITRVLLQALDSMNIGFRREQSRELRQFFETRVRDAQAELDTAETALRRFLESNRVTQNSPLLQFEQLRLARAAELKRTLYITVMQQYEEAKLQESRNVPVLTVLMEASLPVRKSGPPRRFIVVASTLAAFVLLLLSRAAPALIERLRQLRAHSPTSSS
jgi:uncharacterized protein involved in exopolysaccharide biosynthesis